MVTSFKKIEGGFIAYCDSVLTEAKKRQITNEIKNQFGKVGFIFFRVEA